MGRTMNMTADEARSTWAKLESAIEKIHHQNASSLSFEELYRTAYTLVLHRHGDILYNGFENSLRRHLRSVRDKIERKIGMSFVSEVLSQWSAYHKSTQMIRDILMVRR
jgi:cullin 3